VFAWIPHGCEGHARLSAPSLYLPALFSLCFAGITGGVANVTIVSEGGGPVSVLSPWPASPTGSVTVTGTTTGQPVPITWSSVGGRYGGPLLSFNSTAGGSYLVALTPALVAAA
jgi:hypothetical protein